MRTMMIASLFLIGCQNQQNGNVQEIRYPVRVTVAKVEPAPLFIETLGHVESIDKIEVRSRISGELTGIFFTQGQQVKKGDLLFTIDSRPYEAALQIAKGALEQSLAKQSISQEKVKRYKTLTDMNYYSQINYETLQSDFAEAQGLVQENKGRVDQATINLDYCWIYAPIDGLTGIQQIDLGNLVSAEGATPLVTLNQISPIYVTLSIPEAKLYQVQRCYCKNDPIPIWAAYENFKEEVFEGKLFMIDNTVDEKTGMIKIRALFENEQKALWPGQFVRTRIILSTMNNAVLIPYTAVQLTEKGPIAFVVQDKEKVEQRSLKLGQREEEMVIVLEGIKGSETVVIEGQLNLFQGAKVEIHP